jgi:hypothetical protein
MNPKYISYRKMYAYINYTCIMDVRNESKYENKYDSIPQAYAPSVLVYMFKVSQKKGIRIKRQPTEWKKIFASYSLNKGLISSIDSSEK